MTNCAQCKAEFEIADDERCHREQLSPTFSDRKYLIPDPTFCPDCRHQHRMAFRNERTVYKRVCDSCKKSIISIYPSGTDFPVYCAECWWADRWDPMKYGSDYDFSRPFFDQLRELIIQVPKIYADIFDCENCEYTNISIRNRNCFMAFAVMDCEDCFYSRKLRQCKNVLDSTYVYNSEWCYECLDCTRCYNSAYLESCSQCADSLFLADCTGCNYCIGCTNLRNKSYHIFNRPVSPEEFQEKLRQIQGHFSAYQILRIKFEELKRKTIHRSDHNNNVQECRGDYLENCKNCFDCYDVGDTEGARYVTDAMTSADFSMDCTATTSHSSYNYESVSTTDASYCCFTNRARDGAHHLIYCDSIYASQELFGCVGLRHKKYCILNKQYSKAQYEALAPKIIEHMKRAGEWGQFFPASLSPFGYNETLAQEFFPLNREQAKIQGWSWRNQDPKEYQKQPYTIPDYIVEVKGNILEVVLACEKTGRNFRVIPQELEFYRRQNLPLPRFHPDARHVDRFSLRNPRHLWSRTCAKCSKPIQTTYSPDRPEKVACETCYLKEVY
ncbi:MAG: hypothetical protein V1908_01665 [Candidatus Peregrinibacteria bacterium]